MAKRRIYIAHAGGTIGMRESSSGWIPAPRYLEEQMRQLPMFHNPQMPEYTIQDFDPLLDSANTTPNDWRKIALDIAAHIDDFDGVIVLHGTDTMAYAASAMAFMLQDLTKPVILTGSQVPLANPRSDGIRNLTTSMLLAAHESIPEVTLFFNQALYRGCRTVKAHSQSYAAFASPNFPPLAVTGHSIDVQHHLLRYPTNPQASLRVHEKMDPYVGALWLFPGITAEIVRNFLRPPLKGAVILAFGVGNGPSHDSEFLAALREAHDRGVVLVDCTQCWAGGVVIHDYATGSAMAQAGVISGHDMTTPAALTKLHHLFGLNLAPDEIRRLVSQDLRGELSANQQRAHPSTP